VCLTLTLIEKKVEQCGDSQEINDVIVKLKMTSKPANNSNYIPLESIDDQTPSVTSVDPTNGSCQCSCGVCDEKTSNRAADGLFPRLSKFQ
jgi:hypothetical protein